MLTSPSGKSYVGQTTKTLKERFAQHRTAKTHTAIARAIAKYGADAFVVQELLRVDESLLDHYEQKFIDAFRTMAPHGYNLTSGGSRPKNISEEVREKMRHNNGGGKNPFFGKKHTAEYKQLMSQLAIGKWTGEKNPKFGVRGAANPKSKAIRQYALDGAFVREYDSLTEAGSAIGLAPSGITAALAGGKRTAGGWQWRFATAPPPGQHVPPPRPTSMKVALCDKNGGILRVFDTITKAAAETGTWHKTITKTARGGRVRKSYMWKFV